MVVRATEQGKACWCRCPRRMLATTPPMVGSRRLRGRNSSNGEQRGEGELAVSPGGECGVCVTIVHAFFRRFFFFRYGRHCTATATFPLPFPFPFPFPFLYVTVTDALLLLRRRSLTAKSVDRLSPFFSPFPDIFLLFAVFVFFVATGIRRSSSRTEPGSRWSFGHTKTKLTGQTRLWQTMLCSDTLFYDCLPHYIPMSCLWETECQRRIPSAVRKYEYASRYVVHNLTLGDGVVYRYVVWNTCAPPFRLATPAGYQVNPIPKRKLVRSVR